MNTQELSQHLRQTLQKVWGYPDFRPPQLDLMLALLEGEDVLGILPTGAGKSLCFQVPALLAEGVCLVLSPLISLMNDQVEALKKRGIRAAALHSGLSFFEQDYTLDNAVNGAVKILYLAPERLGQEMFIERLKRMKVSFVVVDEAHCVSEWGHDFRPPYLEIGPFRNTHLPDVPLMALTASATPAAEADIVKQLGLRKPRTFRQSVRREELSWSVFAVEDKEARLLKVLLGVLGSKPGAGIVYVRTRKKSEELARWLSSKGLPSTAFHAGIPVKERERLLSQWLLGQARVMVATSAFGMGIDKADVRVVVSYEPPESLESLYQEMGRAGRDRERAYAVALYNTSDLLVAEDKLRVRYPQVDFIRQVYKALASYFKLAVGSHPGEGLDFDFLDFQHQSNLKGPQTWYALQELESQGYIALSEAFYRPPQLKFRMSNLDLYEFQIANRGYEPLIKGLTRLYGGDLFAHWVPIQENALARALDLSESEVKKQLDYLHKLSVLHYTPGKDQPQLTWLVPRLDAQTLHLDRPGMQRREDRARARWQAVLDLLQQETGCRQQQIQAYFGESGTEACGRCDLCLGRGERAQHHLSPEQILALIPAQGLRLDELKALVKVQEEAALAATLRQLLVSGQLVLSPEGILQKNGG